MLNYNLKIVVNNLIAFNIYINKVFIMQINLSNIEKKALRKKAYSLKPVVMIGQKGLTDAVLVEIDIALNDHKLIKVRIRGSDKNKRNEQCLQIEQQLNAEVVNQIGGITVLYRPAPIPS